MNSSILIPLAHHAWVAFFGRGGGGSKLRCVLQLLCVDLDPGPEENFSCISTP